MNNRQKKFDAKKAHKAQKRKQARKERSVQTAPRKTKTSTLNQKKERVSPSIEDATIASLLETTGNWPDKMLIEVGRSLHDNRSVQPVLEDDAEEGASYDDRVGITYAPLDIQSCGFCIRAEPSRIGVTEVATYAKTNCKSCYGLGKWKVRSKQQVGEQNFQKLMQDTEYEKTCPCAEKAYQAKHKNFLIDSQLGEWIKLHNLTIDVALDITVEGISEEGSDEPPELLEPEIVGNLPQKENVLELPQVGEQ